MPNLRAGFVSILIACLSWGCADAEVSPSTLASWPPKVGQPIPDMTVLDHAGKRVALSSFKGKVLLIEPIGMSCPGCVGFCGGAEHGAFAGVQPQPGLSSLTDLFARFAGGASIDDDGIAIIQMLFFNLSMETPSVEDAAKWAKHFKIDRRPNHYVVIGPAALRDKTHANVPGYWLVDKDFVLQCDSTGHHPPANLYTDLLPMVPRLLETAVAATPR